MPEEAYAKWQLRKIRKRLLRAERLMSELIAAHDASEMSNYQNALEAIRKFLQEI